MTSSKVGLKVTEGRRCPGKDLLLTPETSLVVDKVDMLVLAVELMEEAEIDLGFFEKEPVDEVETEREDEVEEVVE